MYDMQTRRKTRLSIAKEMEPSHHVVSESEDDLKYQTSVESEFEREQYETSDGLSDASLSKMFGGNDCNVGSCPELNDSEDEIVTTEDEDRHSIATPGTVIHAPCIMYDASLLPTHLSEVDGTSHSTRHAMHKPDECDDASQLHSVATSLYPCTDNVPSKVALARTSQDVKRLDSSAPKVTNQNDKPLTITHVMTRPTEHQSTNITNQPTLNRGDSLIVNHSPKVQTRSAMRLASNNGTQAPLRANSHQAEHAAGVRRKETRGSMQGDVNRLVTGKTVTAKRTEVEYLDDVVLRRSNVHPAVRQAISQGINNTNKVTNVRARSVDQGNYRAAKVPVRPRPASRDERRSPREPRKEVLYFETSADEASTDYSTSQYGSDTIEEHLNGTIPIEGFNMQLWRWRKMRRGLRKRDRAMVIERSERSRLEVLEEIARNKERRYLGNQVSTASTNRAPAPTAPMTDQVQPTKCIPVNPESPATTVTDSDIAVKLLRFMEQLQQGRAKADEAPAKQELLKMSEDKQAISLEDMAKSDVTANQSTINQTASSSHTSQATERTSEADIAAAVAAALSSTTSSATPAGAPVTINIVQPHEDLNGVGPNGDVSLPPLIFKGGNWTTFRNQFEKLAKFNRWSEEKKAMTLYLAIQDTAAEALGPSESKDWTYPQLVAHMEQRHGRTKTWGDVLPEMLKMRREPGQKLSTYHDLIIKRLNEACMEPQDAAALAFTVFVNGLQDNPRMVNHITSNLNQKERTIQSAYKQASYYESKNGSYTRDHFRVHMVGTDVEGEESCTSASGSAHVKPGNRSHSRDTRPAAATSTRESSSTMMTKPVEDKFWQALTQMSDNIQHMGDKVGRQFEMIDQRMRNVEGGGNDQNSRPSFIGNQRQQVNRPYGDRGRSTFRGRGYSNNNYNNNNGPRGGRRNDSRYRGDDGYRSTARPASEMKNEQTPAKAPQGAGGQQRKD